MGGVSQLTFFWRQVDGWFWFGRPFIHIGVVHTVWCCRCPSLVRRYCTCTRVRTVQWWTETRPAMRANNNLAPRSARIPTHRSVIRLSFFRWSNAPSVCVARNIWAYSTTRKDGRPRFGCVGSLFLFNLFACLLVVFCPFPCRLCRCLFVSAARDEIVASRYLLFFVTAFEGSSFFFLLLQITL